MTDVWIQLYVGKAMCGEVYDIDRVPKNISALKRSVYEKCQNVLTHCSALQLFVYSAGTEFPQDEKEKLDPGDAVLEYTTTSKNPLGVVAPTPQVSQSFRGRCLCCHFGCILCLQSSSYCIC
jgi:hypothetical protein